MRIKAQEVNLVLKHDFTTARKSIKNNLAINILLEDEKTGLFGLGECVQAEYFGDTLDLLKNDITMISTFLAGITDFFAIENIDKALSDQFNVRRPVRSAIIMAIYDIIGKHLNVPLFKLWGLSAERPFYSAYTIGIDSLDKVLKKAEEAKNFPILKIKVADEGALTILETVKSVCPGARVFVDANCGWTFDKLKSLLTTLEKLKVELIEQPFPPKQKEEYLELKKLSPIPIFADESVTTAASIQEIKDLFHGINIKLVKCGGPLEALKMIRAARALGLKIMIGCMIESSISITAASHLTPLVDYIDLDGNILISNDQYLGTQNLNGQLILPERPGLGVKSR